MNESSNKRSASEVRKDIAGFIVGHANELPDLPAVKEFVEQHGRLSMEIAAAKKRGKRLAKAKEKYEPIEIKVLACRDALKNAESELAKLHRPLGKSAFQAFIDGSIDEQAVFSERSTFHKRVQVLQKERDGLTPGPDAGMIQKTKAKAQQLAIAAKIKIEETKVGKLDTEIGRKIVEDKLDESVRCDSSTKLLGNIAEHRKSLATCSSELQEADAVREKTVKQLCEAVPLQHIESSKSLDAEIKPCKKTIREAESTLSRANSSLIDGLAGTDPTKLPDSLTVKLDELKTAKDDASERMQQAGETIQSSGSKAAASVLAFWGRMGRKGKAGVVGSVAVVLIVAVISSRPGDKTEELVREAEQAIAGLDYTVGPNGQELIERNVPNETNQTEEGFMSDKGKFIRHGMLRVWYVLPTEDQEGKKKYEVQCVNGLRHGRSTQYHESGDKNSVAIFVKDKQHGLETSWFEDGYKQERYFQDGLRQGPFKSWWANGKIATIGQYKDGEKDGKWTTHYDNGQLQNVASWAAGTEQRFEEFYDDGSKATLRTITGGHITEIQWWENGKIRLVRPNPKNPNESVEYYPNGDLRFITNLRTGKRRGFSPKRALR